MSGRRRSSVKSINEVSLPKDLLKGMSVDTLKTVNDESTFYEFFQGLNIQDVKDARERCKKLQEAIRELALKNTEFEPRFTEAKEELRVMVTEAQDLKANYDRDYQELKQFQNRTELPALRKQLQQATKAAEESSDDFAYNFVNGKSGISVEEFIESLVAKRSEYWLRKVKLDKFDELSKNRRPVPTPRARQSVEGPPIPYPAPPMQSLPVGQSPRRTSEGQATSPASSLPPYPANPGRMPNPAQQPFPAAAYTNYRLQQPAYQPSYPPARPSGYPPANRPSYPPPRPSYSQFNQHRY